MDINESLEADWIQIRAILNTQVKRLESSSPADQPADAALVEAGARTRNMIKGCEKLIGAYSVKA